MSRAKCAASLSTFAEQSFQSLREEYHLKYIKVQSLFVADEDPAKAIQEAAKNYRADLVVVGSRGRGSAAAEFVLGSVTEDLIGSLSIPLLAVKIKGAGMGLLEALLNV